jgi:hypothetical protein
MALMGNNIFSSTRVQSVSQSILVQYLQFKDLSFFPHVVEFTFITTLIHQGGILSSYNK